MGGKGAGQPSKERLLGCVCVCVCVSMVNKTDSNTLPQVLGGRARNHFIKKSGRRMRTT